MDEIAAKPASRVASDQAIEVLLREFDFVSGLIHLYRQFQMQAVGFAMVLYAAILGLLGATIASDRFGAILLYSTALVPVPIGLLILAFGVMEIRIRRASQYIDLHIRRCINGLLGDVMLPDGRTFLAWERSPGALLTKYQRGMASSAVFIAAMAVPACGAGIWYAFLTSGGGPVNRKVAIICTLFLIAAIIHTTWLSFAHETRVFRSASSQRAAFSHPGGPHGVDLAQLRMPVRWIGVLMGLAPHPDSARLSRSPESRPFHQTLAATVVGVLAGFVANGFVIATALYRSHSWTPTVWCLGLSLVLGASALARLKTHFAVKPEIHYSHWQFGIDLLLIAFSGVVFGLMGGAAFGTGGFWLLVLGLGSCHLARNIVLNFVEKYWRWRGSLILWIGLVLVAGIEFSWWSPTILTWSTTLIIGYLLVLGAAVQIVCESRGISTS